MTLAYNEENCNNGEHMFIGNQIIIVTGSLQVKIQKANKDLCQTSNFFN